MGEMRQGCICLTPREGENRARAGAVLTVPGTEAAVASRSRPGFRAVLPVSCKERHRRHCCC